MAIIYYIRYMENNEIQMGAKTTGAMVGGEAKHPFLRLHIGVLLAGATSLFGRWISISELPLVWWRVVLSAIILTLVLGASHKLHRIPLRHLLMIGGCGLLLAVHWVFFYGSIKAANVSIGAICVSLYGFFTALVEPIINRHRASVRELCLGVLSVLGIVLIFGFDDRYRLGIALGGVAALMYALFAVSNKRVEASTGYDSSTMLLYELVCGGIALSIVTPLYGLVQPDVQIIPSENDIALLVVFAAVFTIIPFLLQLQALRSISAFTVNLSNNLEPVYSIILAMLIFGETSELNGAFYAGVAIIVLSVVLQTILTKRKKTVGQ